MDHLPRQTPLAILRHHPIVRDEAFQAIPELVKARKQPDEVKFPKLMAYLANPVSRRVRANNHVERTNRMFRLLEKVRSRWRRRRTLVRFVVVTLDSIWKERTTAHPETTPRSSTTGTVKTQDATKKRRRVA
jgi:hypothetical protein